MEYLIAAGVICLGIIGITCVLIDRRIEKTNELLTMLIEHISKKPIEVVRNPRPLRTMSRTDEIQHDIEKNRAK